MPSNVIDFSFSSYKRGYLFLKKPYGTEFPEGWQWQCGCGRLNPLTKDDEQYCPGCGMRLRLQTQREGEEAQQKVPGGVSFTVVRVSHFTVKNVDKRT
jgi:sarcosine oxidase delta subunit